MKALIEIKSRSPWVPTLLWRYFLQDISSFAEVDAPVSDEGPFPVIIFMPGIAGDALYNVYLEELASHGYVVLALEPPGDVSVSIVGGDLIELNKEFQKSIDAGDREAIYAHRRKAHEVWKKDISATIKYLYDKGYKYLDLSRIGLLGHSHGGAVVTDYCAIDERCRSGVNMDGWTRGAHTTQAFDKPFLLLANEQGLTKLEELARNMPTAIYKKIPGAGHGAFSDMVLIKQPLRWYLGIVTYDPAEVRRVIQKELVTFFDRTLTKK